MSGPPESVAVGIILFFLGLGFLSYGFIWLKQKRLVENTPTSKIRSIAMGLVEINGEVMPEKRNIIKTPFSNKDCVYYYYSIDERKTYRDAKGREHSKWVTVKTDINKVNFYLKDDTGSVLVDPTGANTETSHRSDFESGIGKEPSESIKNFLKINNIDYNDKRMRYYESFIALKDKMYIFGTAADNPFFKEGSAKKGVEDVMIQMGSYNRKRPYDTFYYISNKSEREILERFKWKVPLSIFGGGLLMITGLIVILKYFDLL